MKKTYIQPSIEAVKLQANTILAGSGEMPLGGKSTNQVLSADGEMGEVEE